MTPSARMTSSGGAIKIAAVGDISLGLIDGGIGDVDVASQAGNILSADPNIAPNILAGSLKLAAATGIKLTYAAKAVTAASSSGIVTLVNSQNGTVISNDPALQPPPAPGDTPLEQSVDQSINAANAVINSMTNNLTLSDPSANNGRGPQAGNGDDKGEGREKKGDRGGKENSRSDNDKDGSKKMKVCNP